MSAQSLIELESTVNDQVTLDTNEHIWQSSTNVQGNEFWKESTMQRLSVAILRAEKCRMAREKINCILRNHEEETKELEVLTSIVKEHRLSSVIITDFRSPIARSLISKFTKPKSPIYVAFSKVFKNTTARINVSYISSKSREFDAYISEQSEIANERVRLFKIRIQELVKESQQANGHSELKVNRS